MARYKIKIQYDGSAFFGWQLQSKDRTVQGEIEKALLSFSNESRIIVNGAGRTDPGVHATGQVAHFDLETRLDESSLKNAINGHLPKDCRIMTLEIVDDSFHARFTAIKRHYRYQCMSEQKLAYRNQCWMTKSLKIDLLNECANIFCGTHDFLSYSKFNEELAHTQCIIYDTGWKRDNGMIVFSIWANRFLHHMVRYIVGCTIQNNYGSMSLKEIKDLLDSPQKNVQIYKAPAQGLFLDRVDYA